MLRHAIARWVVLGLVASFAAPALAEKPDRPEKSERPNKPDKDRKGKKDKGTKRDPGGKQDKLKDLQEKRKARLDKQAERLEKRAEKLREQGKNDQAEKLEKRAAQMKERADRVGGDKDGRRARKLNRIKSLKRKYGGQLKEKPVQQELRVHAHRMAKLERMKTLAAQNEKPELLERVNAMIEKENARHARRMDRLTKKNEKPADGEEETTETEAAGKEEQ